MKLIKQYFQGQFPDSYKHLRKIYLNSYNHLIWMTGNYGQSVENMKDDPYSKNFWDAQENWDYGSFVKVLNYHFQPLSILDVGCGSGTILSAFKVLNSGLRLLGMDNSPEALILAKQRNLEVEQLNIVKCPNQEIPTIAHKLGMFDLTLCLEVAEHLPFWHVSKLLKLLTRTSNTVVFSAAQPGQGGPLHLNEQPPQYWISKFANMKYSFDENLSAEIKKELAEINIPSWYKTNIMVFKKA